MKKTNRTLLTTTLFLSVILLGASTAMADVLDAKFLTMKLTPNPISTGQKGKAYFQVQNTGTTKWDSGFRLKVFIFRAPSGGSTERDDLIPDPHKLRLSETVIPGGKTEFSYDFVGADWTGDYVLKVTMAKGNDEFGDAETVNLKVTPGQYDSKLEYRDITIQGAKKVGSVYEVNRNSSYTLKANFLNAGEAQWIPNDVTVRSEAESADRRTIAMGTLAMGTANLRSPVPSGETFAYSYTMRTGVPPGKYEITFFLAKKGSIFGDTASIMVNVVDK